MDSAALWIVPWEDGPRGRTRACQKIRQTAIWGGSSTGMLPIVGGERRAAGRPPPAAAGKRASPASAASPPGLRPDPRFPQRAAFGKMYAGRQGGITGGAPPRTTTGQPGRHIVGRSCERGG